MLGLFLRSLGTDTIIKALQRLLALWKSVKTVTGCDGVQAEQAKLQVAASEHQRTLEQQEKMLQDMMLKLHDLKAVQVAI
jgi:hypothetical protein